jgi:ligand-binding sensor domain-containing protein/signal transduction histidine kinase
MRLRLSLRNSNTSLDGKAEQRWPLRWLLAGLMAACLVETISAVDPNRAMSQYIRDQWGAEKGFPGGPVYAITQTADGYLWIGAEKGLVRFDGLNFRLFQHANTPSLPAGPVLGLAADAEGNLWIRMRSPSMLRYRAGKFENVLSQLERTEPGITAMVRGFNGEVLFSALVNGTLRYSGGKLLTLAPMSELPNFLVISMAETPNGDIWMGTRDAGLFRLSRGRISAITNGLPDRKINCLLPDGDQGLWVGTDNGVVRWNGTELTEVGVPSALNHTQALAMIKDRDSNVWIGVASRGLLRLNASGIASLGERGHRAGRSVTALFEDREGNIWVGSAQGIERLRDSVFTTYSTSEGLPSENIGPVYADSKGRAWFAPADGGLCWLEGGKIGRVMVAGLGSDVVYSIAGGKDELWVGKQRGGLTRLTSNGNSFTAKTYTETEGLAQNSVYAVYQSRDGTVWAGTLSGGVSRLSGGKFTTYSTANGLASNTVAAILEGSDGTMWFATPNGLSALSNDRWQIYKAADGLPSENVNCLLEDSTGALWIGTADGLAYLSSGRVHRLPAAPASLQEQILGLADDGNGSLWIATSNHVLLVSRDKLVGGKLSDANEREFELADGLHGVEGVKRHRSVVTDSLGRIWFSLNRGLSVADPARLTTTSDQAIVHIQTISADGNLIDPAGPVHISAARQRITFSFAGLSLAIPERVKFRYQLDGFDQGWSEPSTTREAVYTNLSPGSYRFRVMASNADGLWNSAEAVIGFRIEPMFWQTWWFRLSGALACGLAILAIYRLRLRQLTRQMNLRFEERLAERTRIAQELHDTLLQGFLSASMQLHVAVDRLPADSPARPLFSRVLQLIGQVIEEGRNAIRGIRYSDANLLDLEQAFSRIRQELDVQDQISFRVIVEGRPRALHPILRNEAYWIGREALVNAFRHSNARRIEVELEYAASQLRILIRDDGCGIDPQVLRSGRDGHWGLSGMRERAERIGARFNVRSRAVAGTEVELSVPDHIAFVSQPIARPLGWFARLYPRKAVAKATEAKKEGDK